MNDTAYIFDVDGVINSIKSYEPDGRVIKQIAELLSNDIYVAINTGRGYAWVKENIIDSILELISRDKLDRMFVSAEMGGVIVRFNGGQEQDEHTAFSLLPEQIDQAKHVYNRYSESKNIGWYQGKISMATIDKPAEVEASVFLAEAEGIKDTLQDVFAGQHVKVNVNPDAIDVTTPEAGKWVGAQLIHDWLQSTSLGAIKHFVCFGDNVSDYEMARFLGQQGHGVTFVFTGKDDSSIEHDDSVKFIKADEDYSSGTYMFLKKALKDSSKG